MHLSVSYADFWEPFSIKKKQHIKRIKKQVTHNETQNQVAKEEKKTVARMLGKKFNNQVQTSYIFRESRE